MSDCAPFFVMASCNFLSLSLLQTIPAHGSDTMENGMEDGVLCKAPSRVPDT